jgi:hypothetical protein
MADEKKMIPWTPAEEAEGRRLHAGGLSSPEVYGCLMIARIVRYEAALTKIAGLIDSEAGEPLDDAIEAAQRALPIQPVT